MPSDWLAHPVKRVQVFKDANVKATYTFLGQISINCSVVTSVPPFASLAVSAPLPSLYGYYLIRGSLAVFFFVGCSFCTSQQSGSLGTFKNFCQRRWNVQIELSIFLKFTPFVNLID